MASILEQIVSKTREDLSKRKKKITFKDLESLQQFESDISTFSDSLRKKDMVSIIAEVKKGSPSKGIIRKDFNPLKIAESYIQGGASAISVLTDEPFFKGSLSYLEKISEEFSIPLLRKDFIIDPYQVKEARAYGADAVLLIATICEGNQLSELLAAVKEFKLEALVECYHVEEVKQLNWNEIGIVGVNNRDLNTFEVDLHRGVSLLKEAPGHVVRVSESGIHKPEDIHYLHKNGIHSALIGEYFMRQPDIEKSLKTFIDDYKSLVVAEEERAEM
jgi:indole-3-glycerol phosphate synthase